MSHCKCMHHGLYVPSPKTASPCSCGKFIMHCLLLDYSITPDLHYLFAYDNRALYFDAQGLNLLQATSESESFSEILILKSLWSIHSSPNNA